MRRVFALLLASTSACALVTSFDGFDVPKDAGVEEAGTDAGQQESGACEPKRPPPPPPAGQPGNSLGVLDSAVKWVRFSPDTGPPGFDLDGVCTCPEPASCAGAMSSPLLCDHDAGVDNQTSNLFATIDTYLRLNNAGQLDDKGLLSALERARFGVVLRLWDWNGTADDEDVKLALLNAFDVVPADAGARFDGKDEWVIDESSYFGGSVPPPSSSAYVTNGTLVARFALLKLKLRIPTVDDKWLLLTIDLGQAQLVGRIAQSKDGLGRDSFAITGGEIGGRVRMENVFALAASVGYCFPQNDPNLSTIVSLVCERRDIMGDPGRDQRGDRCDAISAGLAFESGPARVAPDAGKPSDEVRCGDASLPTCR